MQMKEKRQRGGLRREKTGDIEQGAEVMKNKRKEDWKERQRGSKST